MTKARRLIAVMIAIGRTLLINPEIMGLLKVTEKTGRLKT